jgi:hypothetical protein
LKFSLNGAGELLKIECLDDKEVEIGIVPFDKKLINKGGVTNTLETFGGRSN